MRVLVTGANATAYCMSKRGLTAYSDSLRLERLGVTLPAP